MLDELIGRRVRAWREAEGVTSDELARRAAKYGAQWSGAIVVNLEHGDRRVTLDDVATLVLATGMDLPTLLAGWNEHIEERRAAAAPSPLAELRLDAERKAAAALGITPAEVVALSRSMWGHTLTDERDDRLSRYLPDQATPRTVQALRGHTTRQLLAELREALCEAA